MILFFERVVALREENHVKYDGKFTTDSPSRGFLEVTCKIKQHNAEQELSDIKYVGAQLNYELRADLLYEKKNTGVC